MFAYSVVFKLFRDLQNMAFNDVLIIKGSFDSETCLLLAAPSYYFKEDGGHRRTSIWVCMVAEVPADKTALASIADSMLSKPWTSRTQRKSTAKLC